MVVCFVRKQPLVCKFYVFLTKKERCKPEFISFQVKNHCNVQPLQCTTRSIDDYVYVARFSSGVTLPKIHESQSHR
jgi:hypothetical protein